MSTVMSWDSWRVADSGLLRFRYKKNYLPSVLILFESYLSSMDSSVPLQRTNL